MVKQRKDEEEIGVQDAAKVWKTPVTKASLIGNLDWLPCSWAGNVNLHCWLTPLLANWQS